MNWPALLARRPWTAAFGLGLGLSLCTAPASIGTALLANALLPEGWFGESAAGDLDDLSSLGFLLLGVPNAILFGMLTAVATMIPYAAIIISALLPITLA